MSFSSFSKYFMIKYLYIKFTIFLMKRYSKYGWIKKILQDFDMFKSPANLRIKKHPDSSQYCSSIFSMLLIGFFIFVLILQYTQIFRYQSINTVQSLQMIQNCNQPSASNILFAVSPSWQSYNSWNSLFTIQAKLITQQKISPKQYKRQQKIIQLERCKRQQWANFTDIYDEYDLNQLSCVKNPKQIFIHGVHYLQNITFLSITLKRCHRIQNKINITCLDDDEFYQKLLQLQKKSYSYYSFYIIDTSISADKQYPINKYIRMNYDLQYSIKIRENINLYLGTYSVQTDVGLFPFPQIQTFQGYFINQKVVYVYDKKVQINPKHKQIFGQINVLMTNKKKIFQRKRGKIDEVISYAGGLFGILIAFFSFFINSYNEYSYELKVAEASFNYDQHGKQLRQKDFNFFTYIKYSVFDWIHFMFCYEIDWKHQRQQHSTKNESCTAMDVMNLFRKIQVIQIVLDYIFEKNQLIMLNLIKKSTIHQIRKKRKQLEYYKILTQGKVTINVQDFILKKQSLRVYAQQRKKYEKDKVNIKTIFQFALPLPLGIKRAKSVDQQMQNKRQKQVERRNRKISLQISPIQMLTYRNLNKPIDCIKASQENHMKANQMHKMKDQQLVTIKQQTRKKFIKYSGIKDEQIIDKICQYTEIAKEAERLKLDEQMLKIQQQFALAYYSLNTMIKSKIVNKIPLKILHRLTNLLQNKFIDIDTSQSQQIILSDTDSDSNSNNEK